LKETKVLETKIKQIDKIKDENDQRDLIFAQMNLCVYKSIDSLKSMKTEFEILAYKEQI